MQGARQKGGEGKGKECAGKGREKMGKGKNCIEREKKSLGERERRRKIEKR